MQTLRFPIYSVKKKKYPFEGRLFAEMVTEADNFHVAAFLESMEETGQALGVLQCSISLDHDEPLPVRAVIKPTSYDGAFSLSLQIKLADAPMTEHIAEDDVSLHVEPTGLMAKEDLLKLLEISVQQVASGKGQATLLHATIDGLAEVHKDKGVRVSQKLEKMVGDHILSVLGTEHAVASLDGGKFLLLLHIGGETGVKDVTDKLIAEVQACHLRIKASRFH